MSFKSLNKNGSWLPHGSHRVVGSFEVTYRSSLIAQSTLGIDLLPADGGTKARLSNIKGVIDDMLTGYRIACRYTVVLGDKLPDHDGRWQLPEQPSWETDEDDEGGQLSEQKDDWIRYESSIVGTLLLNGGDWRAFMPGWCGRLSVELRDLDGGDWRAFMPCCWGRLVSV